MATVLVLSSEDATKVLPRFQFAQPPRSHHPRRTSGADQCPHSDVVVVDARGDLVQAKALCRILTTTGISAALMVVVTEAAMPALNSEWGFDDVVLTTAGPGEVDARIRLITTRTKAPVDDHMISASGVTIDEVSYQAKVNGKALDLTFKEFELLAIFSRSPPTCVHPGTTAQRSVGL
jgi:DNA-binding response OmpR family regulator